MRYALIFDMDGVTTSHDKAELLEAGVTMAIDNFKNLTVEEIIYLIK